MKKERVIKIRVTSEEHERIAAQAEKAGVSLSALLRERALHRRTAPEDDMMIQDIATRDRAAVALHNLARVLADADVTVADLAMIFDLLEARETSLKDLRTHPGGAE